DVYKRQEVDNADINQRLMETIEWISEHTKYVRIATADGFIDADERENIQENSYKVMTKWQEHLSLLFRVFCAPEKGDASECAAPGVVAHSNRVEN
ncbi:DNA-binding protein, partial [Escherichia coli]